MGNNELLWSQWREIGLNLELIWPTPRYFIFLQGYQCSSRLLRDFSGTLCSSLSKSRLLACLIGNKELPCTERREIGPHLSASGKSHGFSRGAAGTCGMFASYGGGSH